MNKPTKEQVDSIDLSIFKDRLNEWRDLDFINAEAGKEHYKLLAYISTKFDNVLFTEVGTLDGCGALALSYNQTNKVQTFDISHSGVYCKVDERVERKLVYDGFVKECLSSPVIFYDTDHNGILERQFLLDLYANGYKGMIIFDDIYLNEPMEEFWNSLQAKKEDWTDIGHWSGTGIVYL